MARLVYFCCMIFGLYVYFDAEYIHDENIIEIEWT